MSDYLTHVQGKLLAAETEFFLAGGVEADLAEVAAEIRAECPDHPSVDACYICDVCTPRKYIR